MTTKKKLSPCPCCGKKAKISEDYIQGYLYVFIECKCGMRTDSSFHSLPVNKEAGTGKDGIALVTKIWNRRDLP